MHRETGRAGKVRGIYVSFSAQETLKGVSKEITKPGMEIPRDFFPPTFLGKEMP